MEQVFIQDECYDKIHFTTNPIAKGEYENCVFTNCDFSNADISDLKFFDCEFRGCNLSLAKILKTVFKDAHFKDCKMLGLLFENCNDFCLSFRFENCCLDHASFYQKKIKGTLFKDCQIREVDFTGADLNGAVFENCDLAYSKFENSFLENADFRSSWNYAMDPELNRLKKAKFSWPAAAGLLGKYDIEIDNNN